MTTYRDEVSRHLRGLRRRDREAALADLDELLASGVDPADLGSAAAYAETVRKLFGVRTFRLPGGLVVDAPARARVWAPQDPRVLVPRAFGLGWRVNAGRLAVRAGWLRPDDVDADVVGAIPPPWRRLQAIAPGLLGAAAVTVAAALAATGERVPVNLDVAGRPSSWADRRLLAGVPVAAALITAWGRAATSASTAARDDICHDHGLRPRLQCATGESDTVANQDVVARPALAASANATLLAIVCLSYAAARHPDRAHPIGAANLVLAPVLTELAMTVLPLRAGLRHVTEQR